MKDFKAAIFILFIAGTLQACNHSAKTNSGDADTSNSSPDTLVALTNNAAPDTLAAKINLVIDKEDSLFAVKAASGNLGEIEMGNLAIKNGKSKRVKNFGLMMIKDHGKANTKLMAIALAKKLTLPTKPDTAAQAMLAQLAKKSGADFDRAYISMMIADHKGDVSEFTEASTKIQDPEIKAYAKKTLPVLQKHLDAINAIHDSMSQ
jgi:putative membrane protein